MIFYKPTLKRSDMDAVLQTMVDEHIGTGEKSQMFMQNFAENAGCAKSLAFRTYPDCIRASLQLADVNQETTVAISALAPALYFEILQTITNKIVIVDVDTENGMPNVDEVEKSGADVLILYENCGSLPVKYNSETTFFEKQSYGGIKIIEDISESIGSTFGETAGENAKAGSWGKIVLASLEANNIISAGGGAILSAKTELVQKLKDYKQSDYLKMTDLNASLGMIQLDSLEQNNEKCRTICAAYSEGLKKNPAHKRFGLTSVEFKSNDRTFAVFLNCKPDDFFEFAKRRQIPLKRTFANSICSTIFGDLFEKFPNAAAYFYRTLSFPIYPFLSAEEIKSVAKIVANLP